VVLGDVPAPRPLPRPLAEAAPITLSIVTTNDIHGRIQQMPLLGGYVRNVRAARVRDGGAALLLDAGDIFQGTLESNATEGASMVRAFQALDYAAVTLGNHEFDFGPVGPHATPAPGVRVDDPLGALKARVAQATFPFLNANLQGDDGKPLAIPRLRATLLLKPRGVKVGIVGGVTMDVLRTTHADNTKAVHVAPLADAIVAQAHALRAQGARLVIALVHAGGECRELHAPDDLSSCVADSEVFQLARALPAGSVDVIVAGHTHAGIAQRVNGIAIVEAFSNGRAFGRVDVTVPVLPSAPLALRVYPPERLCAESLDKPNCAAGLTYEGLPVARDPAVLRAIANDLRRAQLDRDKLLGIEVVAPVLREGKTESALNNLIADLMLEASPGADAAFNNAGGVRISLPKGQLRYGTVFEMFPFDNLLATLKIPARQLASILAHNLESSSGILALSGMRAAASCIEGQLAVQLFDRAGKAIAPERLLTVITSDFLASSGDGAMTGQTFAPGAVTIARDRLMRDVLLERLLAYPGGKLDGRDKRLWDPEEPRMRYVGERPVQCTGVAAARR
jgi:5'-nucleotidase